MADDSTVGCDLCSKTFPDSDLLLLHKQVFHTPKSFICETCGRAFRFRSNLRVHETVHTDELKPIVCKFCGRIMGLKENMDDHILKCHSDTRFPDAELIEYNTAAVANMLDEASNISGCDVDALTKTVSEVRLQSQQSETASVDLSTLPIV